MNVENKSRKKYNHKRVKESLLLKQTNEIEITKIMKTLKNGISCGIACLSNEFVEKYFLNKASFNIIFNQSINQGIITNKMKITKVIPLSKNDTYTDKKV